MDPIDEWANTPWESAAVKSLDTLAESIGPSTYYGFPRVPWDSDIIDYGSDTRAGITVTPSTALRHPAVWAAVRVISEDIASLPLPVYERVGKGKERAYDHPMYEVLHDFANPEMTSFQWRLTMMGHLLTWGNCYSEKIYDRANRLQLWPIKPERVTPFWDGQDRKRYRYQDPNGATKDLAAGSVFHVAGLGYDGLRGYAPITMMREAIGEGQSAQRFAAGYWKRGMAPKVWFETPPVWPKTAKEEFREALGNHEGSENAHRSGLLPSGIKPHIISLPIEDAQFLESRKHNVTDIARAFRLPPHKIMDLERATFSNIEHQSIDYVVSSLRPWLVNWEQEIKRQLLPDTGIFAEFILDALLRGDAKARAESNQIRLRNGALTPDEWRAMENQNPYPGGIGDRPYFSADLLPSSEGETEEAPRLTLVKAAQAVLMAETREHRATEEASLNGHADAVHAE